MPGLSHESSSRVVFKQYLGWHGDTLDVSLQWNLEVVIFQCARKRNFASVPSVLLIVSTGFGLPEFFHCHLLWNIQISNSCKISKSNFLLQSAKNMANAVYTSSSGGSGCKVHPEKENKCHPDSDVSCLLKSSGRFQWCCEAVVGATVLNPNFTNKARRDVTSLTISAQQHHFIDFWHGSSLLSFLYPDIIC